MPKNHRGEPTRVTGLFSREGAVPPRQNDMSALAYLRSQAAEARASGEKPYSLFMVSPERVLGMKRAAEVGADAPRDPRPVTRRFASPRPRRKRFFSLQPLDADRDPTLAARHDSQPFRSVEDGGDAETYRYAKTPRTAVKTVRSTRDDPNLSPLIATRENFRFPRPIGADEPPDPPRSIHQRPVTDDNEDEVRVRSLRQHPRAPRTLHPPTRDPPVAPSRHPLTTPNPPPTHARAGVEVQPQVQDAHDNDEVDEQARTLRAPRDEKPQGSRDGRYRPKD